MTADAWASLPSRNQRKKFAEQKDNCRGLGNWSQSACYVSYYTAFTILVYETEELHLGHTRVTKQILAMVDTWLRKCSASPDHAQGNAAYRPTNEKTNKHHTGLRHKPHIRTRWLSFLSGSWIRSSERAGDARPSLARPYPLDGAWAGAKEPCGTPSILVPAFSCLTLPDNLLLFGARQERRHCVLTSSVKQMKSSSTITAHLPQ